MTKQGNKITVGVSSRKKDLVYFSTVQDPLEDTLTLNDWLKEVKFEYDIFIRDAEMYATWMEKQVPTALRIIERMKSFIDRTRDHTKEYPCRAEAEKSLADVDEMLEEKK